MDFCLFKKGVDEVVEEGIAGTIGFHILGEPLLYPRIGDAVNYASSRGLRTELTTNGSLLIGDKIEGLVKAGLDLLRISLQMIDRNAHQGRGSRVSFDEYYAGVMNAIRLIRERDCEMDVVLAAMNTSMSKFFDIDKSIRTNGNGSGFRKNLSSLFLDAYAAVDRKVSREEVETALRRLSLLKPRLIRIDDHVAVSVLPFGDWGNAFTSRKVYPAKIGFCGYALNNVGVLSNGEVTICCPDYDGRTSLGNLRAKSLTSLLSSEQAQAIREGFQKMRIVHPYCQRCIGSTNRIKAMFKGLVSICLFKGLKLQTAGRIEEISLIQA